jgi:hypothetical protein
MSTVTEELYVPEDIDKTAPFTIATSYCTGRTTVDYRTTARSAVVHYTHKITSGVRCEDQNIAGDVPVHIRLVSYISRYKDGEIRQHIDSGPLICPCTSAE